jgi:alanyl-tRNA synthetase
MGEKIADREANLSEGGEEMRKVMLLAAMLAMVLAAGAPAFAQSAVAGSVQYVDCDQIQAAIGQYQNANADDFSSVAQELGVSQNQVLACFQSAAAGRNINVGTASPGAAKKMAKTATATATATAAGGGGGGGASASAASASALPPTGGVSVPGAIALGAGVLLVAGGLLARRIIR